MADLFSYGPKNIREFFKTNLVPILYTVILHLVIAIVLVLLKVEGLKEDRELGVLLDFTEEVTLEELMEQEEVELPPEWIEQVFEAREQASNRAVNVNDEVSRDISTEDYVDDLLEELESQKDEEFLKDREQWKEIISSYVYEEDTPPPAEAEEEETPYTGPTRITYAFTDPPLDRRDRKLTIPVYRCEGSALVTVDIEVRQDGSVSSAKVVRVESARDSQCFIDAAEAAALSSTFRSNYQAPSRQRGQITYQFVAQ